jgi:type I restriction enzyme, R subunit
MHGFVSQIVIDTDQTLELGYIYARALEARLPRKGGERIDIVGAEIELTYLRTEQELPNVAISVATAEGDVEAFFTDGWAQSEPDKENLSTIVKLINERFGTQFPLAEQVLFNQFEAEWEADPEIIELTLNNQFENFLLIASKKLLASVLARASADDQILSRIFEDKAFKEIFLRTAAQMVFERLNKAA